jgi:tRNA(Ile)-lysidine synthase
MIGLHESNWRKIDAQTLYRTLFNTLQLPDDATIHVGVSGGLDSVVLLHLLATLRKSTEISLTALHAHHGLHPDADKWQEFCERLCAKWSVTIKTHHLDVRVKNSQGYEASARKARYQWYVSIVKPTDYLLLAHHRDDQAETVLLNLLRGAGIRGLSAMSLTSTFERRRVIRPLLGYDRQQLIAYADEHQLRWVEDASNRDLTYSRNYLRHQIVPLLRKRWSAVSGVLAYTAERMRRTQILLEEVAAADLQLTVSQSVEAVAGTGHKLSLSGLGDLSDSRFGNLLSYWLRTRGFRPPSHRQMDRVIAELIHRSGSVSAIIRWPGAEVRRYDDWLYVLRPLPQPVAMGTRRWDIEQPLIVPELNMKMVAVPVYGAGLARARITTPLVVRWRQGGERCRLVNRAHRQKLKKLLQERRVPPWVRERIPLVYVADEIAAVVDYWYCDPFVAGPGEAGIEIKLCALADQVSTPHL